MEIETSGKEGGQETQIAVHPLAIVHMSDQYTRISCGGSRLEKTAPVVGLLFGLHGSLLQIRDADEIPVEISDGSKLQVELHQAVFPQHNVVGWYRVSIKDEEPTSDDLKITQLLKAHYSPTESFCFCLLHVQQKKKRDDAMKMDDGSTKDTLSKDLPINLYELHQVENSSVLLGLSNWQLETSDSEKIAVERVMKEKPSELNTGSPSQNPYILETKAMQHSLTSMKDRVQVLISFLEDCQSGKIPPNPSILRQIQGLVSALGPLSTMAETANKGGDEDVQMLAHLALVSRTVNAIQVYTDKFRIMHENRTFSKEIHHAF